jgi:RHS repeat-associated protein
VCVYNLLFSTHSDVHETTAIIIDGGTSPLDYDKKGNLVKDENGQVYNWDQENRLITAVVGAATNGYVYDALGRRLAKTTADTVTTFIHDGAQVIDEYEAPRLTAVTLGAPTVTGSSTVASDGTVTLVAGGTDIYGTADQGRYTYAMLSGNGTISAKVTSQTNTHAWAKAGVMLRDGTAANAMYASVFVTPGNGVTFQRRTTTGGTTSGTTVAGLTAPQWLSLSRSGNDITAKTSADGIIWTTVGSAAFTMPTTLTAGCAATSHNASVASTVTFTNLSISGNVSTVTSPALARRYVYGSYVDEALAMIVGTAKYYYHANHLYSVAALTDSAKNVVERYRYDAFGQRTVLAADGVTTRAASSYNQQIGFTGRYLDKETGLYYFRARYYSGSLGRFIGRDPLGYVDGYQMYMAFFAPNWLDAYGLSIGDQNDIEKTFRCMSELQSCLDKCPKCPEEKAVDCQLKCQVAYSACMQGGDNPDPKDTHQQPPIATPPPDDPLWKRWFDHGKVVWVHLNPNHTWTTDQGVQIDVNGGVDWGRTGSSILDGGSNTFVQAGVDIHIPAGGPDAYISVGTHTSIGTDGSNLQQQFSFGGSVNVGGGFRLGANLTYSAGGYGSGWGGSPNFGPPNR